MQPKWYKRIQILMIFGLVYCTSAILDIMVSLKYETEFENACVSIITGDDLCFVLTCYKVAIAILIVLTLLSLGLKNRLVKQV